MTGPAAVVASGTLRSLSDRALHLDGVIPTGTVTVSTPLEGAMLVLSALATDLVATAHRVAERDRVLIEGTLVKVWPAEKPGAVCYELRLVPRDRAVDLRAVRDAIHAESAVVTFLAASHDVRSEQSAVAR